MKGKRMVILFLTENDEMRDEKWISCYLTLVIQIPLAT